MAMLVNNAYADYDHTGWLARLALQERSVVATIAAEAAPAKKNLHR